MYGKDAHSLNRKGQESGTNRVLGGERGVDQQLSEPSIAWAQFLVFVVVYRQLLSFAYWDRIPARERSLNVMPNFASGMTGLP